MEIFSYVLHAYTIDKTMLIYWCKVFFIYIFFISELHSKASLILFIIEYHHIVVRKSDCSIRRFNVNCFYISDELKIQITWFVLPFKNERTIWIFTTGWNNKAAIGSFAIIIKTVIGILSFKIQMIINKNKFLIFPRIYK